MQVVWVVLLAGLLWAMAIQPEEVRATVFYESSTEGRSCDAIAVDGASHDGATWDMFAGDPAFPFPYTRCAISTPAGTKYWQWTTICAGYDGNGRCSPANDGAVQTTNQAGVEISTPFNPTTGTVLYLATFARFSRIGSRDIWQDTGGSPNSWDKYLEFGGSTTRWGLGVGWPSGNYTGTNNKWTIDVWCSGAAFGSWCTTDHLVQNQNGYGATTPILMDYDRWYALVMAITLQANGTGRIRVYVNGTLVLDRSQQTTNTSPNIDHIILHGTIAQGSGAQQYDAPDHHRYMDRILFTDDLTYLTNAGLMSDPEAGGDTTPPAAPTSVFISKRQE